MALLAFGMLMAAAFFGAGLLSESSTEQKRQREEALAARSPEEKKLDDQFHEELTNHITTKYGDSNGEIGLISAIPASIEAIRLSWRYVKAKPDLLAKNALESGESIDAEYSVKEVKPCDDRQLILYALSNSNMMVKEIVSVTGLSDYSVRKHIKVLEKECVVKQVNEGVKRGKIYGLVK